MLLGMSPELISIFSISFFLPFLQGAEADETEAPPRSAGEPRSSIAPTEEAPSGWQWVVEGLGLTAETWQTEGERADRGITRAVYPTQFCGIGVLFGLGTWSSICLSIFVERRGNIAQLPSGTPFCFSFFLFREGFFLQPQPKKEALFLPWPLGI